MKNDALIDEYLEYLEGMRGFAIRTLKKYKSICTIRKNFLNTETEKSLSDAKPTDFPDYIEFRRKTGNVKNATVSAELHILCTCYKYLYDFGEIPSDPTSYLPKLICEPPAEKKYLTVNECFNILKKIDTTNPVGLRNYTIMALLWSTGLRSAELCSLDWKDIDLTEGTLLVRKAKGGKQRQLFLNDRVLQNLIDYKKTQVDNNASPVFSLLLKNASNKRKPTRLTPTHLFQIIRPHGRSAGLKKNINPLTFRHTFATHMYEAGASMRDIKEMLGHDDETESTVYVHISMNSAKRFLAEHISNSNGYR